MMLPSVSQLRALHQTSPVPQRGHHLGYVNLRHHPLADGAVHGSVAESPTMSFERSNEHWQTGSDPNDLKVHSQMHRRAAKL
jgi:hypothetical protein